MYWPDATPAARPVSKWPSREGKTKPHGIGQEAVVERPDGTRVPSWHSIAIARLDGRGRGRGEHVRGHSPTANAMRRLRTARLHRRVQRRRDH